ncbi:MAG: hypothetical protein K6D37_11810 [Prevotella sp.]|nr:hypothetical protein [Prevotella sp.]
MKKGLFILIGAALLMSSCGSYEATGAYTGSQFGHVLGSAIGGISGGWRGHEIGSIIGTVGGAAAGAAIGHAADKAQERKYEERATARQSGVNRRGATTRGGGNYGNDGYDQSGFDPSMRGDDRIVFDEGNGSRGIGEIRVGGGDNRIGLNNTPASSGPMIVIRNAGIYETMRDGMLSRGESCKVIFEIQNNSSSPAYDVFPLVEEATGNKHIHISPNLRIESIAPHQAVRYTATLTADRGLRNGQIQIRVGVAQGDNLIHSQTRQFTLTTVKRATMR